MTAEKWRPVVGWEDLYEVSDHGRVRSLRSGQLRKLVLNEHGYPTLLLHGGGKHQMHKVHRLVLIAFDRPPIGDEVCRHLNGTPTDNRLENLKWGTRSENAQDTIRHGRHRPSQMTHCIAGHSFDEHSVSYTPPNGRTQRVCKSCEKIRNTKEYQDAKRTAA